MTMPFDAMNNLSDDDLVARFAVGDQAAARALTMRLLPGALALSRRMLGDAAEAEDVAQEAMLRLWKIAPDWQAGRAKPSTWLHHVTRNLCIDTLRKRQKSSRDEMEEPIDDSPGAMDGLIAQDRAAAMNSALARLPERQRIAIHLRHFEEHTNMEIAEIMGVTVETVEGLIGRGKRKLVEMLRHRQKELGLT